MKAKNKNNSVSYFDMQFITSSISTTLVLLLLGLVVFFVLTAHNLSVYVKENINFSIIISDDMKETDIRKYSYGLRSIFRRSRRFVNRLKPWGQIRRIFWDTILFMLLSK